MIKRTDTTAKRIERVLGVPMMILTVVFIVVLTLPILDHHLPAGASSVLNIADLAIWAAFAVEYVIRLIIAPDRWFFIRHNVLDLLLIAVPILRPLRLVRAIRLIRALRFATVTVRLFRESRLRFAGRAALLAAFTSGILILTSSVLVLDAERSTGNIKTLQDALWWSVTTMSTTGYGDRYPVTGLGRVVGIVLMIAGVAMFGIITASFAAWFLSVDKPPDQSVALAALTEEVRALRTDLNKQKGK